jgi:dTMP kinase
LIRKALLEVSEHEIASSTELFLYLADRAQHVNEIILPAMNARSIVLCDRFTDSTLAYQGYGRGIDLEWLRRLNDHASGGVRPDLTFLFDCPVEISLARTARRRTRSVAANSKVDRFERETVEFHERVRLGFLKMAEIEPQRFRVIDATRPVEEISAVIRRITEQELLK